MGEELVLARNRFILGLLRQNFAHVEGPRLEDENSIIYDVWNRNRDPKNDQCVRIAFERRFLGEADNEFAATTLHVLREAKGLLHGARRSRRLRDRETERADDPAEIGYVRAREQKGDAALFWGAPEVQDHSPMNS